MQPHFGANPGRERGFAGDFTAESGLLGRILASGSTGRHAEKRPTPQTHVPQEAAANVEF